MPPNRLKIVSQPSKSLEHHFEPPKQLFELQNTPPAAGRQRNFGPRHVNTLPTFRRKSPNSQHQHFGSAVSTKCVIPNSNVRYTRFLGFLSDVGPHFSTVNRETLHRRVTSDANSVRSRLSWVRTALASRSPSGSPGVAFKEVSEHRPSSLLASRRWQPHHSSPCLLHGKCQACLTGAMPRRFSKTWSRRS